MNIFTYEIHRASRTRQVFNVFCDRFNVDNVRSIFNFGAIHLQREHQLTLLRFVFQANLQLGLVSLIFV